MNGNKLFCLLATTLLASGCASNHSNVDVQAINPDYDITQDSIIGSYEYEISKDQTVSLNKYVNFSGELCIQYVDSVTGDTSLVSNDYGFESYSYTVTSHIKSYCEKDFKTSNIEPQFTNLLGFESISADDTHYFQSPLLKR